MYSDIKKYALQWLACKWVDSDRKQIKPLSSQNKRWLKYTIKNIKINIFVNIPSFYRQRTKTDLRAYTILLQVILVICQKKGPILANCLRSTKLTVLALS